MIDSTNAYLEIESATDANLWPDFSAVVADCQTAGQGRLGRDWISPKGRSLSVSILFRSASAPSWLSPAAALSLLSTIQSYGAFSDTGLKWPNDVLVSGRKLSGVLVRATQSASHVVGVGINLRPIAEFADTSISLEELGVVATADEFLATFLAGLRARYQRMLVEPAEFVSDIRHEYAAACITLGRPVRAELPDGREIRGTATAIDDVGRLLISSERQYGESAETLSLAAADVWHLRNL